MRFICLAIFLMLFGAQLRAAEQPLEEPVPAAESVGEVAEELQYVVIADPYIDIRTGPGRGYPITQIAERGEEIALLKRRTQWFKVRTSRGYTGWVFEDQLQRTLQPRSGEVVAVPTSSFKDFRDRTWETGVLIGDFDGSTTVTGFGAYRMSRHLALEVEAGELYADNVDGWLASIAINHTFVPEWRVSPFFLLGTGIIDIEPKRGLMDEEDQNDQYVFAGAGFRAYLTRRFLLRAEYRGTVILDDDDENEDINEWKAGFAVFF